MDTAKTHVSNELARSLVEPHLDIDTITDEAEQLNETNRRLESIERRLANIEGVMSRTEKIISNVAAEVMPTIEALAKNPMIKALGIGGKFGGK